MNDARTLGVWMRRFLTEHIVGERNLARNTQISYRDTFALLLPFVSRKLRKPVDRLAVLDLTFGTRVAVPRTPRAAARLLAADPEPTPDRHPRVRALRGQPQPRACRLVRPDPRASVEEGGSAADRMAGEVRDGRRARRSGSRHAPGPPRTRPAAVPLQQRSQGIRSRATHRRRPATERSGHRPFPRDRAGQERQAAPVPALASHRRADGRPGTRAGRRGPGLPEPVRKPHYPLRHQSAGRSLRGCRGSQGAVDGRQTRRPARDPAHDGDPPAARAKPRPQASQWYHARTSSIAPGAVTKVFARRPA